MSGVIDWDSSTKGYIQLYAPDGTFISQHRLLKECTQSAFKYAVENGVEGDYRCVFPEEVITIDLAEAEEPGPTQLELFDVDVGVGVV